MRMMTAVQENSKSLSGTPAGQGFPNRFPGGGGGQSISSLNGTRY